MASLSAKLGGKERGYRDMKTEQEKVKLPVLYI